MTDRLNETTTGLRFLTPFLLLLLLYCGNAPKLKAATTPAREDSVVIEKKKIVIIRTGKLARDFPERRRAVISYPVIKGGQSPMVLRKVRSLLQLKNIFDTSLAEYKADAWLDELDYQVNYNRNFILDITFTQSGVGAYPDTQTKHFAINLKTGEVIKASEAFKPTALRTLADMADRKLQEEVRGIIKDNSQGANVTDEDRKSLKEQFEQVKFEPANLDEFSVNGQGITFLYDAGFPHVIAALEPAGQYFFSYAELRSFIKADGPLGSFVK
ncbi:MAG TPA: hypothetical protein VGO69_01035 [Pyrinomonadaceae bacterium]|nr:hypothetical protein [Pyrinomonadaceae bacterium]